MARKEKPLSACRRLERSLPRLSPLMREAYASLWTDAQCDAWGRRSKSKEVIRQANVWLLVADGALKKPGAEDLPWSRQRLAWLASLTVQLENEAAGVLSEELSDARRRRDDLLGAAKVVRARALSRASLLVGGDEARGAALAVANKGSRTPAQVSETLEAVAELLTSWRREARLRLLADELGLDAAFMGELQERAESRHEAETAAISLRPMQGDGPALNRVEGRVLRELRALQLAFSLAHDEGLNVPKLRVNPALKSVLSSHRKASGSTDAAATTPDE